MYTRPALPTHREYTCGFRGEHDLNDAAFIEVPTNYYSHPSRHNVEQRCYNVILTFQRRFNVHARLF